MQLPAFFQQFFSRKPAAAPRILFADDEDTPALQARALRPLEAPASIYNNVASYIMRLSVPDRQQLMLAMYDQNMYVEHLTNRLINPILGKTGFMPIVPNDAPATQAALDAFWETDELTDIQQQERICRDFLIIGEVFDLIAPCGESYYTAPILPALMEQTVTDPRNYHQLCGVKQRIELGVYQYHPLVTQERRLSPEAMSLRARWRQAGGFDCLVLQNLKKTAPIPGNTLESSEMYQKRGEPFLTTSADLFKMLVDYLWTSLDRAQALNTFNWGFGITLPERLKNADQATKQAYIDRWQAYVKTPKPNSAFFYPAEEMSVAPFSFPSGVASAMEGLFKMMRNTAGWTAASRDEDMGDADSRFATMKQPGVTNPTVETLVMLQKKIEVFHARRAQYVLERKAEDGLIPRREYEIVRGQPRFKFQISSPEISKQDFNIAAQTMNVFEQGWNQLAARGVYTLKSLVAGEQKMVKELYGIDLDTDADALKRLETQMAQPPTPPETPAAAAPAPQSA